MPEYLHRSVEVSAIFRGHEVEAMGLVVKIRPPIGSDAFAQFMTGEALQWVAPNAKRESLRKSIGKGSSETTDVTFKNDQLSREQPATVLYLNKKPIEQLLKSAVEAEIIDEGTVVASLIELSLSRIDEASSNDA